MVRNMIQFYGEELLAHRPTPQSWMTTYFGCPRLLIQYIRTYLPYWRPFLRPQNEDAPCRGDRDRLLVLRIRRGREHDLIPVWRIFLFYLGVCEYSVGILKNMHKISISWFVS